MSEQPPKVGQKRRRVRSHSLEEILEKYDLVEKGTNDNAISADSIIPSVFGAPEGSEEGAGAAGEIVEEEEIVDEKEIVDEEEKEELDSLLSVEAPDTYPGVYVPKGHLTEDQHQLIAALVEKMTEEFQNYNEKLKIGMKGKEIEEDMLEKWHRKFLEDEKTNRLVHQAISDLPVSYIAQETEQTIQKARTFAYNLRLDAGTYSQLDLDIFPTNQLHSGRCWMFAGLNYIRRQMIQVYSLPRDFELSESFLFYYDKIERSYAVMVLALNLARRHRRSWICGDEEEEEEEEDEEQPDQEQLEQEDGFEEDEASASAAPELSASAAPEASASAAPEASPSAAPSAAVPSASDLAGMIQEAISASEEKEATEDEEEQEHTMDNLPPYDTNDPFLQFLLSPNGLMCDGGTWQGFVNLVHKYGIVPKSCYHECFNSSFTDEMNQILNEYVNQCIGHILDSHDPLHILEQKINDEFMPNVVSLMTKFMGRPPEKIVWEYQDRAGTYHKTKELTPEEFYASKVGPLVELEDKACLVHDPRTEVVPLYHSSCVYDVSTMIGGKPSIYVNVPLETLHKAVVETIRSKSPVWFAADVGDCYDPMTGNLASEHFNYQRALNLDFGMDKRDRLRWGVSLPTHAMLFIGANEPEEGSGQADRFRVENSWGWSGADRGFHMMTADWFERNVYMCVVDRKHLEKEERDQIEAHSREVVELDWNDPFGAVAVGRPDLRLLLRQQNAPYKPTKPVREPLAKRPRKF